MDAPSQTRPMPYAMPAQKRPSYFAQHWRLKNTAISIFNAHNSEGFPSNVASSPLSINGHLASFGQNLDIHPLVALFALIKHGHYSDVVSAKFGDKASCAA
ncbi:unnamed protein product, partial [Aphanomyces euteiches]